MVWIGKVPDRLKCLNIWSPLSAVIWEGCKTYRWWSLARGSGSLVWASKFHSLAPFPVLSLSASCLLGQPHNPAAMPFPSQWTVSLSELQANSFLSCLCQSVFFFIPATENKWIQYVSQRIEKSSFIVQRCFYQSSLQRANRKQSKCPLIEEWINTCGVYIHTPE